MPLMFNRKRTIIDILYYTPMGASRRKEIMHWFNDGVEEDKRLAVNCKYTRQIKFDTDLQKLLKLGLIKTVRERRWSARNYRTYVVKV